ncbi:MAG: DNA primase [Deltaproteobacteria bacterium]|nr:DNA primase [Deltaproteobacteria bacterium]
MISHQSAKEEIKQAADIVSVVGQFVQLRKAGKNFVGLCPFHGEKAPSFTVSQDRQMFHCFGCKKGGDVFAFWMEYHSLSFPEALRDLAEKYNVRLPEKHFTPEEKKKADYRENLYNVNELAAVYFQKELAHPVRGKPGRDYLEKRSISHNIIKEFRLGYAPKGWDGLKRFLLSRKISLDTALTAGVLKRSDKGHYYDLFRERVMYPIMDLTQKQRVIGFGGRVLDDTLPKYVNTPETPLFHKGTCLYGFSAARKAIRETGRAVVVEGYMDCLALRKHGLKEVVATLGTALSETPVRKLKGIGKEAVVVFDADEAGKAAALRTLPIFLNERLSARAVILPKGHDPDSFVNDNGREAFSKFLDAAPSLFDFYMDHKLGQDSENIDHRVDILEEILPILTKVRNETQRALYIRRLSERCEVAESVIISALRGVKQPSVKSRRNNEIKRQLTSVDANRSIGEIQFLNLLLHYPETVTDLKGRRCRGLISDPMIRRIVDVIFEGNAESKTMTFETIQECLDHDEDRVWLREFGFRPAFCSDKEVKQAVQDFIEKAQKKKITDSFKKAMGNPQALNEILRRKVQAGGPIGS